MTSRRRETGTVKGSKKEYKGERILNSRMIIIEHIERGRGDDGGHYTNDRKENMRE